MKIAVTGSSGLIGRYLVNALKKRGDFVYRVVRSLYEDSPDTIRWFPEQSLANNIRYNADKLSRLGIVDAVIHLAGENIAGIWSKSRKKRIYDSRVVGTRLLAGILTKSDVLKRPPKVFISASAVGYYGDRGDEIVNEEVPAGEGFLARVCADWESATRPIAEAGIRTANLRFGMVLCKEGGALGKMLPFFRLGLGGRLGSGRQYWSWIGLEDAVRGIIRVLDDESISGVVNMVSPDPVTNGEFTRTLGKALGRPAVLPVPGFLLKMLPGGFGKETLLASVRAIPEKITRAGFGFKLADINSALNAIVG